MEQTVSFLEGAERAWQVGTSFPLLIARHTASDEIIGTVEPRSQQARVSYG
jgi:hypothetical protein